MMDFNVRVQHQIANSFRSGLLNEPKAVTANGDNTRRLTVETIGNHCYFYSDVDTDRCLDLIRQIRDIDNMLRHERISREMPSDSPQVPIWLHINSGGGDAFTGPAIADQLKRIQTPIYTIVEGLCASAATFISMVGTKRYILPNSFMLIHEASTFFFGKHSELKDEEKLMGMLTEQAIRFYRQHSKLTEEQVREMLKHDYWMNAEEALEHGLVDEILE